jgi:hypothetical protein
MDSTGTEVPISSRSSEHGGDSDENLEDDDAESSRGSNTLETLNTVDKTTTKSRCCKPILNPPTSLGGKTRRKAQNVNAVPANTKDTPTQENKNYYQLPEANNQDNTIEQTKLLERYQM